MQHVQQPKTVHRCVTPPGSGPSHNYTRNSTTGTVKVVHWKKHRTAGFLSCFTQKDRQRRLWTRKTFMWNCRNVCVCRAPPLQEAGRRQEKEEDIKLGSSTPAPQRVVTHYLFLRCCFLRNQRILPPALAEAGAAAAGGGGGYWDIPTPSSVPLATTLLLTTSALLHVAQAFAALARQRYYTREPLLRAVLQYQHAPLLIQSLTTSSLWTRRTASLCVRANATLIPPSTSAAIPPAAISPAASISSVLRWAAGAGAGSSLPSSLAAKATATPHVSTTPRASRALVSGGRRMIAVATTGSSCIRSPLATTAAANNNNKSSLGRGLPTSDARSFPRTATRQVLYRPRMPAIASTVAATHSLSTCIEKCSFTAVGHTGPPLTALPPHAAIATTGRSTTPVDTISECDDSSRFFLSDDEISDIEDVGEVGGERRCMSHAATPHNTITPVAATSSQGGAAAHGNTVRNTHRSKSSHIAISSLSHSYEGDMTSDYVLAAGQTCKSYIHNAGEGSAPTRHRVTVASFEGQRSTAAAGASDGGITDASASPVATACVSSGAAAGGGPVAASVLCSWTTTAAVSVPQCSTGDTVHHVVTRQQKPCGENETAARPLDHAEGNKIEAAAAALTAGGEAATATCSRFNRDIMTVGDAFALPMAVCPLDAAATHGVPIRRGFAMDVKQDAAETMRDSCNPDCTTRPTVVNAGKDCTPLSRVWCSSNNEVLHCNSTDECENDSSSVSTSSATRSSSDSTNACEAAHDVDCIFKSQTVSLRRCDSSSQTENREPCPSTALTVRREPVGDSSTTAGGDKNHSTSDTSTSISSTGRRRVEVVEAMGDSNSTCIAAVTGDPSSRERSNMSSSSGAAHIRSVRRSGDASCNIKGVEALLGRISEDEENDASSIFSSYGHSSGTQSDEESSSALSRSNTWGGGTEKVEARGAARRDNARHTSSNSSLIGGSSVGGVAMAFSSPLYQQLTLEMQQLEAAMTPGKEQQRALAHFLDQLQELLSSNLEACVVAAFGSAVNGLWTPYSDLDVCVQLSGAATRPLQIKALRQIAQALHPVQTYYVETRFQARVPIIHWAPRVRNTGGHHHYRVPYPVTTQHLELAEHHHERWRSCLHEAARRQETTQQHLQRCEYSAGPFEYQHQHSHLTEDEFSEDTHQQQCQPDMRRHDAHAPVRQAPQEDTAGAQTSGKPTQSCTGNLRSSAVTTKRSSHASSSSSLASVNASVSSPLSGTSDEPKARGRTGQPHQQAAQASAAHYFRGRREERERQQHQQQRSGDTHMIACDISVNNLLAVVNSKLLEAYVNVDPRLRTLGYAVKWWARGRYINDRSRGTISSFSLILMLINFLQRHTFPPVLPSLQDLAIMHHVPPVYIAGVDCRYTADTDLVQQELAYLRGGEHVPPNTQSAGELLIQFFRYYGYEYKGGVIDIRDTSSFSPRINRGSFSLSEQRAQSFFAAAASLPDVFKSGRGRVAAAAMARETRTSCEGHATAAAAAGEDRSACHGFKNAASHDFSAAGVRGAGTAASPLFPYAHTADSVVEETQYEDMAAESYGNSDFLVVDNPFEVGKDVCNLLPCQQQRIRHEFKRAYSMLSEGMRLQQVAASSFR